MKESVWKEKDASAKGLGPCNRVERRLCTKKREGILIVKREEKGGISICEKPVKKGTYLTF